MTGNWKEYGASILLPKESLPVAEIVENKWNRFVKGILRTLGIAKRYYPSTITAEEFSAAIDGAMARSAKELEKTYFQESPLYKALGGTNAGR